MDKTKLHEKQQNYLAVCKCQPHLSHLVSFFSGVFRIQFVSSQLQTSPKNTCCICYSVFTRTQMKSSLTFAMTFFLSLSVLRPFANKKLCSVCAAASDERYQNQTRRSGLFFFLRVILSVQCKSSLV